MLQAASKLLKKKKKFVPERENWKTYTTVFPTLQQLCFAYLQTYFRKVAQGLLFLPLQSEFIVFLIFPDQKISHSRA